LDSPYLQILKWHDEGKIIVTVSNRVFDPDTRKMSEEQRDRLKRLLADHRIEILGAPFRFGISRFGAGDLLGGPQHERSPREVEDFRRIVGMGPSASPPSKKLKNQIGDYDALQGYFMKGGDVFVTLDEKGYLSRGKREKYEQKLGLVVESPEELMSRFS